MGTRADFYIGRGPTATWLGSVGYDGFPGEFSALCKAKTPAAFRKLVERVFKDRDDVTRPARGWPWPWPDSCLTDYAYAFDAGYVWVTQHGAGEYSSQPKCPQCTHNVKQWARLGAVLRRGETDDDGQLTVKHYGPATFPDMAKIQNVTLGKGSGLLIVQIAKDVDE